MTDPAPLGAPRYQVIKTAFKDPSGKWTARYSLKAIPLNPTAQPMVYDFEPAGSGDEDYNEYNLIDPHHTSGIAGASIQFHFAWAALVDHEGYSRYDCR